MRESLEDFFIRGGEPTPCPERRASGPSVKKLRKRWEEKHAQRLAEELEAKQREEYLERQRALRAAIRAGGLTDNEKALHERLLGQERKIQRQRAEITRLRRLIDIGEDGSRES
jgi:hypothetical protein